MNTPSFGKYTALSGEHKEYLKAAAERAVNGPYRPSAHIVPPCGLLNDPNGLCWYEGFYHVFYQWHPFGPSHGMKHWAHVKSADLCTWEWCDEMLIPVEEYEKNGCYSGNAFVNEEDGLCYLYYTANYKTEEGRIPKQALAVMDQDGNIRKYKGNPIIDGAPERMSGDIRDPFVFQKDGSFYMLLGAADVQGRGQLLLYSSQDLKQWAYEGPIRLPLLDTGTMVECPGLIQIDGKDVLFLSLIGIGPDGERYHNQFSSLYLTGRLDLQKREFVAEYKDEADCGFDFYAPQMFYDKDKKPLLFGWFGCGEQKLPEDAYGWRHGLTLPRRLSLQDGRLCMVPAGEALKKFEKTVVIDRKNNHVVPGGEPLLAEGTISAADGPYCLTVGTEEDFWRLKLDMEMSMAEWDRGGLKKPVDPGYGMIRRCSFKPCEEIRLAIYIDNSFVEIYINDGERVMSGRAYPGKDTDKS